MSAGLRVWGVPLPGEVAAGADLAALVAAAEPGLADGDVVVVTSKVVSKAEGRVLPCPPDPAGREAARQAAIDAETVRVVARREPTRIVETRHGFVLAAAGVDASNTAPDTLVLLPDDADVSARRLRDGLHRLLGVRVAVVVSDTAGRPWRRGLVDVAVGAAGIAPLRDYRGRADVYGNPLALTEMADVDALAAAAELVKGKLAGVPVAVVRGLDYAPSDDGVRALVRPAAEDLFRLGTAEAVAAGRGELAAALRAAVDVPEGPGWPTAADAGITTYRCDDGSLLVGVAADRLAADPALATQAGVMATLACADLVAAGRRVRLQLRGPFPPAPAAVGVVVARVLMAPDGPA